MSTDRKITAEEVDAAIEALSMAKVAARRLCEAYAKEATGWTPGTRIRDPRRPSNVWEVTGFQGIHAQTWAVKPIAALVNVRADGTTGSRHLWIEIDTDGRWERRWERVP